ncbi:MAG: glycerate kinase [Chthoniobacterales bacterium]
MRILVAPDKFKGSLGAEAVGAALAAGLRERLPEAEIELQPIADGGEGTAEVLRRALGGESVDCAAHDALGREIRARFAWMPMTQTACLEMSAAAGLRQLAPDERDPLRASTFGVGEMLVAAKARGAARILIGLGGSATNDGGSGLARTLGFRFLDSAGQDIEAIGGMENLARIESPNELVLPPIIIVADVRNPLLGPRGATGTFGAQKGATPAQLELLERALTRLADVVATSGRDFREVAGAGAAGGLGFGLLAFAGAEMRPGFEVVAEVLGLREKIAAADYVITGEGNLDRQTLAGKGPAGVARLARELGKPVFALVGRCSGEAEVRALFDGVFPLDETPPFTRTAELLRNRGRELGSRLIAPA